MKFPIVCISALITLLGASLTSCADPARAGESEEAKELRNARAALARYAVLKADEFEHVARRTLRATEARIVELREHVAQSEVADDARATLEDLESRSKQLAEQLGELKETSADHFDEARQAVVEGANEFANRVEDAWAAWSSDE